ncbi:MAG: ABC transporter permease [Clostridia bacterium]|nr:ABC transporter permease [Clostridia bacterium]
MINLTFFKKEMKEIVRTHKIIVLPAILLFFGLLTPMLAKYMNKILEPMLKKEGIDPGLLLKEPVLTDAYAQFFETFIQMGLIVVVLIFMGIVADEKVKGSVILVLTKSVSRSQFIISKFFASVLLFTFSFILSTVAFSYYTYILFSKFMLDYTILSFFMLWLLGVFLISVTVFASTISKSHISAAVTGFAGYALTMALSAVPYVKDFSPGILGDFGLQILAGTKTAQDTVLPVIITVILCVIFVAGSATVFKKQEL